MVTSKTQSKTVQQTTNSPTETVPIIPETIDATPDPTHSDSITKFYDGSRIFLTGATGFIGKALLEKLLRSCDGISTIYLLIRTKRGIGVEQRFKELVKSPAFDRIREKKPEYFDKIKVISGDVTMPNLGLSDQDRQTIINNVTIAFHSAATVRFNENLKEAFILNTLGTKQVMQLCHEIKNLKSVIHVSTAYCNADRRDVEETVYPSPHDPATIRNLIETLSPEGLTQLTEKLLVSITDSDDSRGIGWRVE